MTSFNSTQEQTLTAFMAALSHQTNSLPSALQGQLQSIGHNLENRVMELPVVAASIPSLDQSYREALANLRASEGRPNIDVKFVSTLTQEQNTKLNENAAQILTAPDSVKAAQDKLVQRSGQMASNPLKRFFRRG